MELKDCGKHAICGVNNQEVVVSKYNIKCPCLNCIGCDDNQEQKCGWRGVLEMNPCSNEEMRLVMCVNCKKIEKQK